MVASKLRFLVLDLSVWENGGGKKSFKRRFRSGLSRQSLYSAIRQSMELNFGQHGTALCGNYLQVRYFNPITSICVVRCSREDYTRVWCSISFIQAIEKLPALFNLLLLSGNFRACRKKLVKLEAEKLEVLKRIPQMNLTPEEVVEAQSYSSRIESFES